MSTLIGPEKLERKHQREGFDCGKEDLNDWLQRRAWQNQRANNAITYVATIDNRVVGYFALCSSAVERHSVSEEFGKGRPDPIPCVLLARLAVDKKAQGKGLGRALLIDALNRSIAVAESIGAACILVNCQGVEAKEFYLKFGIFEESPVNDLQLIVPMKGLVQAVSTL